MGSIFTSGKWGKWEWMEAGEIEGRNEIGVVGSGGNLRGEMEFGKVM